ncbi:MAG: non-heme iron oxygenase ferredoxin subunit [Chloroflexota bacterium]|nr:non-heme iron oxygenase ferredoxin subunit [Chloroflexota bacterium]
MPEFHVVAQVDELQPGEVKHVEVADEEIALFNLGGEYYALSDVCSHQYALLSEGEVYPDEGTVECPLHGSEFDIRTGQVLNLPATEPVPAFEVRINGTDVEVGLP